MARYDNLLKTNYPAPTRVVITLDKSYPSASEQLAKYVRESNGVYKFLRISPSLLARFCQESPASIHFVVSEGRRYIFWDTYELVIDPSTPLNCFILEE